MQSMTIQPDLQTREAVMVAAGGAQFGVRIDGEVCYVMIECKRKLAGGGYERGRVPLADATHVFISEKGYGTTRLGTYYPPKPGYTTGRFYNDVDEASPHARALDAIVELLNDSGFADPEVDIRVESCCGICGRKLEDPTSIERGIGPDCAAKPTGSKILHASAFAATAPSQEQIDADARAAAEARVAEAKRQLEMAQADLAILLGRQGVEADAIEQMVLDAAVPA
jgi:hypothetical protein